MYASVMKNKYLVYNPPGVILGYTDSRNVLKNFAAIPTMCFFRDNPGMNRYYQVTA